MNYFLETVQEISASFIKDYFVAIFDKNKLEGYIFTTDYAQILRVSRNLEVGIVGVNEGMLIN